MNKVKITLEVNVSNEVQRNALNALLDSLSLDSLETGEPSPVVDFKAIVESKAAKPKTAKPKTTKPKTTKLFTLSAPGAPEAPEAPETPEAPEAPETPEAPESTEEPTVTIEEIRDLLSTKIDAKRAVIKNKLGILGVKNVSSLPTEYYEQFYDFLQSL